MPPKHVAGDGVLLPGQDVVLSGLGEWVAGVIKSYDASTGNYMVQVKRTSRNVNASSQVTKFSEYLYALSGGIPIIEISRSYLSPASTADTRASAQLEARYEKQYAELKAGVERQAQAAGKSTMKIVDAETGAARSLKMPGGRVTLKGLVARPELNGQSGSVQSFSAERERFGVRLDGQPEGAELLAIKMANMDFLDATEEPYDSTAHAAARSLRGYLFTNIYSQIIH